ncbi:MTOR-associated protein MEAK7-like [Zingiber officinale]|uniref:MTOR-associated protein MEAK7-like n=1 Tax=Zingiber officinale TaxID=94328 RepID=UPI001C4C77FB|nr:MTOR-associated protein MEAK7-like [Zingiber officinale]
MGNAQSPPADPLFDTAIRAFTTQELEDLKSIFVSLAAQSGSNGKFVSQSVFQAYFRVPGLLGTKLFQLATRKRNDGMLLFEDLVVTKAIYEKGSRDEIEEFIYQLCDVTGDGILGRSDIEAVINSVNECLFYPKSDGTGLTSHQDVLKVFVNAAQFSEKVEGSSVESMSLADFRSWCSLVPSARKFLGSLLMPPDSGRPGYQVPTLHHSEDIPAEILILRKEYAWHIGGALSQDEVEDWKLLYHSGINGLSFSTFLGNLSNGDGPTVLIIKDNEGFVYGGYASQPWDRQSDFYGDMKCFLYQLYPKASIFRPTGANNNLQWCAVNFSSDSIPNGIGFGGRANHFGLFLSANFDQGHTFPCTTFNSPCLSKTSKIHPEVIECWGVIAKVPQNGKPEALKGTVLERFKEDRNMLKMVGIANSSD